MNDVTGIVEAVKTTPMQGAILVGGDWYSSYRGIATASVAKGDLVEFSWQPDKTGRWKNIKTLKVVTKGAGVATTSSVPTASTHGFGFTPRPNLGVELGHAANLAMEVSLAIGTPPGSEEFYKEFVQHTDKIYKIMRKLRENYEKASVANPTPAPVIAAKEPILADDEPF